MSESNTERVSVRTYIPAYQRDQWVEEAEERDMSQSEYVRTMVQAGRRNLALDGKPPKTEDSGTNPRGEALEHRLIAVLREEGPCAWGDLVQLLTADLENRLEDALETLQERDQVRHSGPEGYVVTENGE